MDQVPEYPGDAESIAPEDAADDATFLLAESPSHLLHRAQQFAAELFAGLYDKHVTLRQFAVLAAVQEHAGGTQTDMVRATGIDRSTLAEMVGRLEEKGLLAREKSSADGRAKTVRLTGRGRARLAEALPHARAADLAILEALPKAKRRALLDILQALTPAIDAAHETPAEGKKTRKKKKKDKTAKASAKADRATKAPKAEADAPLEVAPENNPEKPGKPAKTKQKGKAKA